MSQCPYCRRPVAWSATRCPSCTSSIDLGGQPQGMNWATTKLLVLAAVIWFLWVEVLGPTYDWIAGIMHSIIGYLW